MNKMDKSTMNQLTHEEAKAWFQAHIEAKDAIELPWEGMPGTVGFDQGFKSGFIAGLKYQKSQQVDDKVTLLAMGKLTSNEDYQKKIGAYAAFVNGSITRAELDEVLNDE